MKYIIRIILPLVLLAGCVHDGTEQPGTAGEGLPVRITVGAADTRAGTVAGDDEDYVVTTLRVMGFRTADGTLAFNEVLNFTETGTGAATRREGVIDVVTGNFTVVFIANEKSDPTVEAQLKAMTPDKVTERFGALESIAFDLSAINQDDPIPMARTCYKVSIVGDNKVFHDGDEKPEVWEVAVNRLATRAHVTIKLSGAQYTKWSAAATAMGGYYIDFTNIPDRVYIIDETDNRASTEPRRRFRAVASNPNHTLAPGNITGPDASGDYTVTVPRAILPESYFDDPADAAEAVHMQIYLTDAATPVKGAIGMNPAAAVPANRDYRMIRNHFFDIEAEVNDGLILDINLEPYDWDYMTADGLLAQKNLNVSAIEVSINEHNMARIFFWSDQKEVYIEDKDADGNPVDEIFYGLAGSGAPNFHYDPSTGEGWFDLLTDRSAPSVSAGTDRAYKIYLNAGGGTFAREITVNVSIPSTDFAARDYVGAFWRNDQVGERVIAMANTGSWTATVDGNPGWVVLEAGKSLDPNLWVPGAEPGDPESFPVNNNATSISGTGNIYFRIGLTGPNPDPEKPRYAKILVHGVHEIYIRQGEAPDYLMTPEDGSGNGTLTERPLAAKYTPYNLTSPEYLDGTKTGGTSVSDHSQLAVRGGAFTEYPTQAGAIFQWANGTNIRMAWHPTNPTTEISGWSGINPTTMWGDTSQLGKIHETCPPGYRRPRDGDISKYVSPALIETEVRQSLWWNPQIVTGYNLDNSTYGYLADGFFDRYAIVESSVGTPNSSVCANDTEVAYAGRLYYNPGTNASLFFPAPGSRNYLTGASFASGREGSYWSSSTNATEYSWSMGISSVSAHNYNNNRAFGLSIRCVAELDEEAVENRLARSNIVWMDNKLQFAVTREDNARIPGNVVGLLFRFGSLIGVCGDIPAAPSDFDPAHIVFVPQEHSVSYSSHSAIPYFDGNTGTSQTADDMWSTWPGVGFDATAGLGDICRYISHMGWVEGKWRLPKQTEVREMSEKGKSTVGGFTLEAITNPNGPGTAPISSGAFIGGEYPGPKEQPNEGVVFLPASGFRTTAGQWQQFGSLAIYWCSTLSDPVIGNAESFQVSPAGISTVQSNRANNGRPVRCIREIEGETD